MSETDLLGVFEPFTDEIYDRLRHHSTYLVEMLYDYFAAMNRLIIRRYEANPTNQVGAMTLAEGLGEARTYWQSLRTPPRSV